MSTDSLFTKNLSSINFEDIEIFTSTKQPENTITDYKEDFPKDLDETIVCMLNTDGGLILIGVRANRTENVPEEIIGVDLTNGLEERVISICESNIYPRFIPEVKVVPFKSEGSNRDDKAIVLIRFSEGDYPPYESRKQKGIFVRDYNKKEFASVSHIEKLMLRRQKNESILQDFLKWDTESSKVKDNFEEVNKIKLVKIYVSPKNPKVKIDFHKETDDYLISNIDRIRRMNQNTILINALECTSANSSGKYRVYTRINNFGQFIYVEPLEMTKVKMYDYEGIIIENLIQKLYNILNIIKEIYLHFNISGDIIIKLEFRSPDGVPLILFNYDDYERHFPNNNYISIEQILKLETMNISQILSNILNQLLRSYGLSLTKEQIEQRVTAYSAKLFRV